MTRKLLLLLGATLMLALAVPAMASATIGSVFGSVTCTEQSGENAGQRWCGTSAGTTVPVWDETPIDVAVGFPAATGEDNNYPVVGIYHGWGGTKITPSSASAQRWIKKGYAVFSISDRGWGSSCGKPVSAAEKKSKEEKKEDPGLKAPPCERGYIHLLSRRYEVRDVQTLLGKLADEGVIDPQRIGANGGSYGGGMSLELGALKDRVELQNGALIPWESPGGKPMKIAATAAEFPWTDISHALQPNGSTLDYVEDAPYKGMLGDHRFGIEKASWNAGLFLTGASSGYYAPTSANDPEANIQSWHAFAITGGPYDGQPLAIQQEENLPAHSAYYTNLSEAPAPAIMENGWNDDLFPVDETTKYYNKVRAAYPNQPMQLFDLDVGHNPRSATSLSASDVKKFQEAQNAWFAYYIKGEGGEPANAKGGATAITSPCPAGSSGTEYKANNWAALSPGELRFSSEPEQTVQAPGTAAANAFTSATVCTTQPSANNASAAEYKFGAAPAGGYTVLGSPTVIAEISTPAANDQLVARLYDENVTEKTEQLIGRQAYRPLIPGEGFGKQVFQLHPQAWKVAEGHALKLELMVADQPTCTGPLPACYLRNSSSPHSIQVKNLELRVPTADAPGSAEGQVKSPQAPYLPAGYKLARNERTSVPGQPHLVSGSTPNNNGVFTLAWNASEAATALSYTLEHKNASGGWSVVASGLTSNEYAFTGGSPEGEGTWNYRVTASNEGPTTEPSEESAPVVVDESAPNPPSAGADRLPDYAGGGGWYKDTVTVSFTDNGDPALSDTSPGSGVNPSSVPPAQTFTTDGSHEASGTVTDNAGNTSAPGSLTVQVDASAPNVEVSCPATAIFGSSATATITASDGQSGLASNPSGPVAIDTSTVGVKTTSATATDNVGHEAEASCSTTVKYSQVIMGSVKGKLTITKGQGVEIAPGAKVSGAVKVKPGGAIAVDGATLAGGLMTSKATVVRICGAAISGATKVIGTSGPVTLGQAGGECDASSFFGNVQVKSNTGGVVVEGTAMVEENMFHGKLSVTSNSGGTTVRNNNVAGSLTVMGNSGTVIDTPNTVEGKSKLQ
jgi:dienelactone hydrolase